MSKIAVLLPKEYMLEQARKVIQEKNADIDILKVIKTSDSVYEARKAMEQGAGIIVARGVQAAYIREYTLSLIHIFFCPECGNCRRQ